MLYLFIHKHLISVTSVFLLTPNFIGFSASTAYSIHFLLPTAGN